MLISVDCRRGQRVNSGTSLAAFSSSDKRQSMRSLFHPRGISLLDLGLFAIRDLVAHNGQVCTAEHFTVASSPVFAELEIHHTAQAVLVSFGRVGRMTAPVGPRVEDEERGTIRHGGTKDLYGAHCRGKPLSRDGVKLASRQTSRVVVGGFETELFEGFRCIGCGAAHVLFLLGHPSSRVQFLGVLVA